MWILNFKISLSYTGIYGQPDVSLRRQFWEFFKQLRSNPDSPWICFGDFNKVLTQSEFQVEHIDTYSSDHAFLFIQLNQNRHHTFQPGNRRRPFRFEAMWVKSKECEKVIQDHWNLDLTDIGNKIQNCQWGFQLSKSEFGNLEKRIKDIKSEISKLKKGVISREVKDRLLECNSQLESLLALHEIKWKQRAKQHWFREGDRNSKFFHAFATAPKEVNTISSLRDNQGVDMDRALTRVRTKVSAEMAMTLTQPFTADEVARALKHMHPFKSPGPDGMSPVFFQKFWRVVKNDVTNIVLKFPNHSIFSSSHNYTHIVLIPKVKNPDLVSHFRPISLCNVIYKIASKALSPRLRSVLPSIISESQSVFVPGRLITDNILVAYEIHHSMKSRSNGRLITDNILVAYEIHHSMTASSGRSFSASLLH
ncbi:hypothetical protein DH2020_022312 [Rehmannia glutinosa]|uniref:Reverse transcriptase domain-containing protein n=1 Tax=Rehmannia glutinosa TaxID=99300 RepID=A0ABR0WDH4_REHGL